MIFLPFFLFLSLTIVSSSTQVFIASQPSSSQFTDETAFHLAAKSAGIKYIVRISTGRSEVSLTSPIWYGRSHAAIEATLEELSKEDPSFRWTSLQPNGFTVTCLPSAVAWVQEYR